MIKLLIVDDEPLVQAGLQSMLNWSSYNIEICGTAVNGEQALKLIQQHHPEIVITDIKMPILNGLELAKICKERYEEFPLFIILTSYEEFSLIKEAVRYGIIDYLIKLELTVESLNEVIQKTLKIIHERQKSMPTSSGVESNSFYEKFFITLLHNLFESEQQFLLQCKYHKLDFSFDGYVVCHCCITGIDTSQMQQDKLINLYFSTLHMLKEILSKYIKCYISSLDMEHFCIIVCLSSQDCYNYKDKLLHCFNDTFSMIHNYFNVSITSCIGAIVSKPLSISESYQQARQIQTYCDLEHPLVFFEDYQEKSINANKNTFNMRLFKEDLKRAFEEFNWEALSDILTKIIDLFKENPLKYLQAIDVSCNILYLAISLLPDGEETVSQIFSNYPGGYRSIHTQSNTTQVMHWLTIFRDGLVTTLKNKHKNYKNHIVSNVKIYIVEHIDEKLSLNDVASVFGISPNYLSLLFKKDSDIGFSEYITQKKISRAKVLMVSSDMKIYEISEQLGFESAFYFSKVFKKVEGCSPRDYIKKATGVTISDEPF